MAGCPDGCLAGPAWLPGTGDMLCVFSVPYDMPAILPEYSSMS